MKKLFLALALFLGFAATAEAQTSPCPYPLAYGMVLTAAQWNGCLQYGINALPLAGGTLTGPLITAPSTAAAAGINIPWGVAPSNPNNGDIWGVNGTYTTTNNGTNYNFVLGPTVAVNNHIVTFSGTSGALIQDSGTSLPASGTLVATATGSPAQGDVLYYNGTSWIDLAAGSSGTFLKSNGAASNPTWSAVTAPTGTVITNTVSPAQGDVLYYNGTTWTDLGHGSSGQFLETLGASANPAWATISASGCTVPGGGAQFNPIINNGSSACANATNAFINGSAMTLGINGTSNGSVTLDTTGAATQNASIGSDSNASMLVKAPASTAFLVLGGNAGVELGPVTTGGVFTNKLDYNISNASNWTFGAPTVFPNGDLLLGTGSAYVILAGPGAGTNTATFPQSTSTVAEVGVAQTWTNFQSFDNTAMRLLTPNNINSETLVVANNVTGTITFPAVVTDTVGVLGTADQTLSGGVNLTSNNIGTVSSGTTTIDCGKNPSQYLTNGGAFTLAAPSNDGTCILKITNNGTAGAITFSGFTEGSNTGDALDTVNTHIFFLSIMRTNGTSHYLVSAAQ